MLPVAGLFVWLQFEKRIIKREVKQMIIAGLEKKDLVFFSFSIREAKHDLSWKHSGEFEYLGQMYDLVESEMLSDSVKFWCWPDQKEDRININLDKLVSNALGQNPQSKEQHQRYFSFLKSLYPQMVFEWYSGASLLEMELFPSYSINYSSLALSPPSPPPRTV